MKIKTGNFETLTQVAAEVPHGEDVKAVIDEMWKVMLHNSGIGLAANQVGLLKRIIVVHTNGFTSAIINPVITKESGKLKLSKEGCLSFPGKNIDMKRDNIIVVEGFDENWNPIKKKVRALSAFCVQHEIDHLDGITIVNKGRS
jgi:peptide deformylase